MTILHSNTQIPSFCLDANRSCASRLLSSTAMLHLQLPALDGRRMVNGRDDDVPASEVSSSSGKSLISERRGDILQLGDSRTYRKVSLELLLPGAALSITMSQVRTRHS
jgi:hypothetical protein